MRRIPPLPPALPVLLQRRSSDEFVPPPYTTRDREAVARVRAWGPEDARRAGLPLAAYWASRRGTAAGLGAINAAAGRTWYRVPAEAALDEAAAREALGGDEVVIDVQTHFVSDRPACDRWGPQLHALYRAVAPSWWEGLDAVEGYRMAEYLRCVFLESDTAVAVLTSAPGLGLDRMLTNDEMAGTRALLERLGASGRLLNHAVVHPEVSGELEAMETVRDRCRPVGWKVYTLQRMRADGTSTPEGWWLDDESTGGALLARARELGVRRVCAHKGISQLAPTGSPRDVGPAAAAHPEIDLLVYHSGYEMPLGDAPGEGPWTQATAHLGTNRLVTSLRDAGLAPGSNAYAELGSTWFSLIRRPEEAAHVLGKLLLAVGEDNVLWGTDSIWYGPAQPAVDAFRAFQIPADFRERYGYPELTPERKRKILGGNAARVYGIDLERARETACRDDLAWLRAALDEHAARGVPQGG